jgi:hypothetical protein
MRWRTRASAFLDGENCEMTRHAILCHIVIERESNDRSNLVSCRIYEITTTPERRLVMTKGH